MELFFELIQIAVDTRELLSRAPTVDEWKAIFETAQKQTVTGVAFLALEKLNNIRVKPPLKLLSEWIGLSEQIKGRNTLLNKRCLELTELFSDAGFESCILKGQGNALMYPLPESRTSGDIDIWVNGKRDEIIAFCRSKVDGCKVSHHHIQFSIWKDVDVEVHFIPSYTRIPRYVKRTNAYFEKFQREGIDDRGLLPKGNKLYVPMKEMNLVFQMSHMARHFFYGGIGLKQVMDYYYLLNYTKDKVNVEIVVEVIQNLGLYKFAGAVMWVIKEVFKAKDALLIVPVDEKRGKLLLDEIMEGGNFGHHDKRVCAKMKRKSSTVALFFRNLRLLRLFPEEALWSPIMSVWYYLKYKGA